jgi:UDP:flavonoid glycosyltransferase YjiC (YdhE family)
VPANARVAEFLQGEAAVARAALVVSNGGSATGYQALAAGVPVLGIASNLDQFLFASLVAKSGAGLLMRAGQSRAKAIRAAVEQMLHAAQFMVRARAMRRMIARRSPVAGLRAVLDEVFASAAVGAAAVCR